ncbi:hypothetical protein OG705_28955 [Streptomyces sp. NBC_00838]|uniref:hypothetical protein n=1 Tax=Streptomyces sp. NBC_00838 TaxID=2903680 RepID=UPI003865D104|nr:hypothetical protein OG705_28955 [Streptomyces sp. NBC_00838]
MAWNTTIGSAARAGPTRFADLVEGVRDVLAESRFSHFEDAGNDLDSAVTYLTDALTSQDVGQRSLMAWARTHLRDAIEHDQLHPQGRGGRAGA